MKECPACHRCFPDHLNHCPSDGDLLKSSIRGDTVLDGRYQLEKKLGQGGMGIVFKARHVFLKTLHAVKIILPDLVGNDPTLVTRFRQEAMAAAAIRHPNTISVTDYGIVNGNTPFLVMEFIEGRSLHDLLASEKRLAPARAVELMLGICAGVAAAHKLGIVHRDLKPLNIIIKTGLPPHEGVKVLDFGLAKIKSGELLGSFVAAQTQGMMGSPFYMAPEQWSDEEIDVRADIYSLGVIFYQMLAGEVPFRGASIPAIMNKHLTAPPAPLRERGLGIPEEVERAVAHALEKDPAARPQTVEEFMGELRAAQANLDGAEAAGAAPTEPLAPTDTEGLFLPEGATPGPVRAGSEWFKTVAGTGSLEEGDEAQGRATAPPPAAAPREQASDTARQRADRTSFEQPPTADSGRTTPLDDSAAAEQERRAAEESARREAVARGLAAEQPVPGVGGHVPVGPPVAGGTKSHAPLIALGVILLLAFFGGAVALGYYVWTNWPGGDSDNGTTDLSANANTNSGTNENANGSVNENAHASPTPLPTPDAPRAELVALPGGRFRVGRDDVPPLTEELRAERAGYLLWMYNQWPAHAVNIPPFRIDRTEVTNAEYAAFVRETGHAPPPDVWDGDRPRAGEEQFPVVNVTYRDAEAFARWRSRRDGVTYRLPTEEQWEFAARGGDPSRPYPWGSESPEGRAILGVEGLWPVGSLPAGRSPQGVDDLIGNAWEWTRSPARMYPGNNRTVLKPGDVAKVVVRGGSFAERADGDEPIAATSRRWVAKNFRSPQLGFRLVSEEQ